MPSFTSYSPSDWQLQPKWLEPGDQAWQLTAATLVAFQSIPGLAVLYAGIVKKKWAINSAFMVFYAFACVLICWVTWAYKMGFGAQWGSFPLLGKPGPVLTMDWELRHSTLPATGLSQHYNQASMIYFQFVFAAITLCLIAGSLLGRMNFLAWMIFVPLWLTMSYTVGAFSIWGGGFLFNLGVLDYSGGYVIHVSSGTAGFVAAYWVGPRLKQDRDSFYPNNIALMLVGAGILWTGWNGFNGGDPYQATPDAAAAVLNTNVCTATSSLTWVLMDYLYFKKPSIIGAVQGEITGLVAITPAAGLVAGWGAIVIGVCSGTIPWITLNTLGRTKLLLSVDDVIGNLHSHAVGGFVGGFATGLFATVEGCKAFGVLNPGGAMEGNGKQVWIQLVGALFIMGLNIFTTSIICCFIKYVLRIPLRMSEEHMLIGDDAVHGEEAYALFYEGMRSHIPGDHSSLRSPTTHEASREAGEPVIFGQHPGGLGGDSSGHGSNGGDEPKVEKVA